MCLYFRIVYKKSGAVCTNFLDFMDSLSQTNMKWPLFVGLWSAIQMNFFCKFPVRDIHTEDTFFTVNRFLREKEVLRGLIK